MLPVYNAVSFNGILEKGGRTRPWVVLVATEQGIKPFIVKMFETALIEHRDSVTNEVIGNILAKEFELPTPKAALIDLNYDFVQTIKDHRVLEILENKDDRLKFGTELLEGYVQFDNSAFDSGDAKKMIEIDMLFAYDYLIRNADRGHNKNLLVKSDTAYLIDHELAFENIDKGISDFGNWVVFPKAHYHMFYSYLKNSWHNHKAEYFFVFEEYLKRMNISNITSYFDQLSAYGFSTRNHSIIQEYLLEMKRNSFKFVNLMRGIIQ